MSLKRVSDGGIYLLGWWWLSLSLITLHHRRIRVLAQCKAEKKTFSQNYVHDIEGVCTLKPAPLSDPPYSRLSLVQWPSSSQSYNSPPHPSPAHSARAFPFSLFPPSPPPSLSYFAHYLEAYCPPVSKVYRPFPTRVVPREEAELSTSARWREAPLESPAHIKPLAGEADPPQYGAQHRQDALREGGDDTLPPRWHQFKVLDDRTLYQDDTLTMSSSSRPLPGVQLGSHQEFSC
ncbi:hypothetical protein EDB19DRAFT_1906737 [Suillus lakei]|nr:hypothetical protein EDB19DRAFT_1906737 [Suillus lakei]